MDEASSEARFELLVQSVTDYAIYLLDPDGIVSSWNEGARRFKGYAPDEIIGQHFSRFYSDQDQSADAPAHALTIARREGRYESENWHVRRDGSRFWAHVVIDPVHDPDGHLVGFAKITRDLTERRMAEEAQRQSEERFRLLVESVTDYAIYMLDPSGIVSSWNAGARRAKGYVASEILGQHFSRFYTDEDREAGLPQRALRTAEAEGRFEAEGWRVRKDGSRFWANVVVDPVRDRAGRLVGFAKVTRDLTERREAQQALEKAQAAFFQAQKMDALGKLTGGVAHDFNNLLAAVIGSLEMARRHLGDGSDVTRFIDNARHAAERGAALTQRMLAFARKQELKPISVDVPQLVRGMADLLQRTLEPTISIETRFPLVLRAVLADPAQLELAILNLAVNARDAMPDGGRITIGAEEEPVGDGTPDGRVHAHDLSPGVYVRLSVTDTGEGMDEQTLARATEPFYTTKDVGKGTGLGLSMVHGFADQCGGKLTLESRKGGGTTVSIWLPAATPSAAQEESPDPAADGAAEAGRLLILAVDDDPLVLLNTVAMLEDLNHRVLQARSGKEALDILATGPVDILVTDYAMPGLNGLALAEAARGLWPDLPVILVSGYADVDPGAARVVKLAKPYREAELTAALEKAAPGPASRPAEGAHP